MSTNVTHSIHDVIVALPTHVVAHMLENGAHPLPRPWLYFPPIPPHVRRIWVYEDGEEGITIMITLNRYTLPSRLYYITNPLYLEVMEENYDFHRYQIPQVAPMQILDRFRRRNLQRVW
jgi:hypothetical protein